MNERDMVRLIEAFESVNKINNMIIYITNGYPINKEEYNGLYNIYDVIYDNSKYAGREDDEARDEFRAIMNGINISAREKYELLKS